MRQTIIFVLILGLALTACTGGSEPATADISLTLGDGSFQKQYTINDLKVLPQAQTIFDGITYVGVSPAVLLTDAGIDAQSLKALKAIASDGYSVNYEPALFLREDVILAYAKADGPLDGDDGAFRMVLPGEEGKLNVRMIVEIQAVP